MHFQVVEITLDIALAPIALYLQCSIAPQFMFEPLYVLWFCDNKKTEQSNR